MLVQPIAHYSESPGLINHRHKQITSLFTGYFLNIVWKKNCITSKLAWQFGIHYSQPAVTFPVQAAVQPSCSSLSNHQIDSLLRLSSTSPQYEPITSLVLNIRETTTYVLLLNLIDNVFDHPDASR